MRWSILVPIALTVAGCTSANQHYLTEFEPLSDSEFRYEAKADNIVRPVDDPSAEAQRMEWLNRYLASSQLCPNGYTITSRKVVQTQDLMADTFTIYYRGGCT